MDVEKLRSAVAAFATHARSPYSGHSGASVSMGDLNRAISETVNVLNVFVEELAKLR